ncbi:PQQ-dependent sugar dehydrogenase [Sphingomonas sp. R-74633]|uniref:PQQ-dependent sugar dehydrogenase n=1 Tax=Sphingomonas sp. R-74633 TaxID=2751188 RepID=UPI0015D1DA0E|nr:PQQ-dependent sugar dehydrogenase [Sphingomonas sp. R-74633]NYT43063.1 PQQ-dependent sugar dehydrogenase [Sphingomonas sp. R-74633]
MRIASPLAGLFLLAACSSSDGSGGGPSPTPTPTPTAANTAPSFTSATTASVAENTALAYQATATDAEGNPITFSISGGADSALFSITAAGALSFVAAPSFETPKDADGNNVYQVQIRAADASLNSTREVSITVTDSKEGIAVKRVGTGFNQPLFVAPVPGDNARVFVVEKGGGVYFLTPSTGAKTLAFTATGLTTDGERGLLGLAARPDFATSNIVFVHATGTGGAVEIREYNVSSGAMRLALSTPHASANNHNGGWIAFGPDGLLYDAIGDGGGGGDPSNNAQNVNLRLGKILRLKIDSTPGAATPFAPAPGNVFAAGGGDPYIFAYGLRNPFRNSFDGNTLVIADVGEGAVEELDLAPVTSTGLNFGWKFLEGTSVFSGTAPAGLTAPVSQYSHGTGAKQGNSIIGGYVYRGPVTSLQGSYIFGDYVSGNIWTLPYASLAQGQLFPAASYERRNVDFTPDAGTIGSLVSFGQDGAGNVYLVDIGGSVFMIQPG